MPDNLKTAAPHRGKIPASELDVFIGARLQKIRKKRKFTQSALGERLGVRYQQLV